MWNNHAEYVEEVNRRKLLAKLQNENEHLIEFLESVQRRLDAIHVVSMEKLDSPPLKSNALATSTIRVIAMLAVNLLSDIAEELEPNDPPEELPF
jgi:cell division protein ZapA (FtsZ GTPase activity inhibitor)